MSVGMVAFWGLIVWAVVALVRGTGSRDAPRLRPADVLADRLARGEIGADEYERARDLLETGTGVTASGQAGEGTR